MLELLKHQWKEKIRSTFWQKSLILNIILGLLVLYLLFYILIVGFFADKIIGEIYKEADIVETFTRLLFYYFAFDLIFRFFFQPLATLSIQPYLTLPIKKSKLLHYPLIKSVFSFFNLIPLLLFTPFFVKVVCTAQPALFCISWIVNVLSLVTLNNYLNYSLKKYFLKHPVIIFLLLVLVGLMLYADISKTVSISGYFSSVFLFLCKDSLLMIIPFALAFLSYLVAYTLLIKNSYLENPSTDKRISTHNYSFLDRLGETGNLIRLEIKMILRNKRPRSMIYMGLIFLLYGFLFYQKNNIDNHLMLIFSGLILTSGLSITYGQYSFSWESSYFDTFLVNKISPFIYIKAKYIFLVMTCVLTFLITLPYCLISYKIGLINAAMLLYNTGINSLIMLFLCTYNTTHLDLGRSQFMNYQGWDISRFLLALPTMAVPAIVYIVFHFFGVPQYSYYAFAIIGLIGIIFSNYLIKLVANQFFKRRYKMAIGFRQK